MHVVNNSVNGVDYAAIWQQQDALQQVRIDSDYLNGAGSFGTDSLLNVPALPPLPAQIMMKNKNIMMKMMKL